MKEILSKEVTIDDIGIICSTITMLISIIFIIINLVNNVSILIWVLFLISGVSSLIVCSKSKKENEKNKQ